MPSCLLHEYGAACTCLLRPLALSVAPSGPFGPVLPGVPSSPKAKHTPTVPCALIEALHGRANQAGSRADCGAAAQRGCASVMHCGTLSRCCAAYTLEALDSTRRSALTDAHGCVCRSQWLGRHGMAADLPYRCSRAGRARPVGLARPHRPARPSSRPSRPRREGLARHHPRPCLQRSAAQNQPVTMATRY